jgi:hypothetical protein
VRALLAAVTAVLVVVAASGVYQAFEYQPLGSQWISGVHEWSSLLLVALVVVALFVWLRNRAIVRYGGALALLWAGATVCVIAAFVTGPTLHWEQLALGAASGSTDPRGVFDLGDVLFVLSDGRENTFETFRRTVWVHTTILPVLLVSVLAVVWYLSGRRAPRADATTTEAMT